MARKQGLDLPNNHETYKWLNYFTIWLLFIYCLLWFIFINFLLKGWLTLDLSIYINAPQAISLAISLSILFNCFYLFFNPTILYGIKGLPTREVSATEEEMLHSATDPERHVEPKIPV